MGGLIVLAYALRGSRAAGLAGVIASGTTIYASTRLTDRFVAPALAPGAPVPGLKLFFGRLASHVLPRLTVANGLDLDNMSRVAGVKESFLADPKCTRQISLQTGTNTAHPD